jgi:hypothetical protein
MTNGTIPLYLTLLAAVVFGATLLTIQPYSVTSSWHGYDQPARLYLQAAARHDSLALIRKTSTHEAAHWALEAGRAHPDSVALWAREAEAWAGNRRGETTEVFLSTRASSVCNLVLRFVGSGAGVKVSQASSSCLGGR